MEGIKKFINYAVLTIFSWLIGLCMGVFMSKEEEPKKYEY